MSEGTQGNEGVSVSRESKQPKSQYPVRLPFVFGSSYRLHPSGEAPALSRSAVETCLGLLNGPLFNLQAHRSEVNCT